MLEKAIKERKEEDDLLGEIEGFPMTIRTRPSRLSRPCRLPSLWARLRVSLSAPATVRTTP